MIFLHQIPPRRPERKKKAPQGNLNQRLRGRFLNLLRETTKAIIANMFQKSSLLPS
jgi:hypothetical protein